MSDHQVRAISALQILISLCPLVCASALAAESPGMSAVAPATAVVHHRPASVSEISLNLRTPPLTRVMSHSQLLAAMGNPADDEESIKVVASPELVPMSSETEAPLGIIDSLRWSVDHPAQAWRVVLPASIAP
jgi:hypothetical protein